MIRKLFIPILILLVIAFNMPGAYAAMPTKLNGTPYVHQPPKTNITFRGELCNQGTSQVDMDINNVRARLLSSGDVWWNLSEGRYVVPKVPAGVPEVSSIYAGAVWLGGKDPGGNLKVAAQRYRTATATDFWPGPLNPFDGTTDKVTCQHWDHHFVVLDSNIRKTIILWKQAFAAGKNRIDDPSGIPKDVLGWPGRKNPHFAELNKFELPDTPQALAGFFDNPDGPNGEDGIYDPQDGDIPIIEIRGCEPHSFADVTYPDQMIFWIYNDNGNVHTASTGSDAIKMEVQVQAFAYATQDELNNMTFQRYKLINRADEDITQTYFAMWVDPDLGCAYDDYIGCDSTRSLMYVYNQDAQDGQTGCSCSGGTPTYCDKIPILGVDYFRGPLDENGKEIGMTTFMYYNNSGSGIPPATTDPDNANQVYNYMQAIWKDGTPLTIGGTGYNAGSSNLTRFAFLTAPDDQTGWSMCSAALNAGDRRTIQASGPFTLKPSAINELIVGVPWVPDQQYPCPSIKELQNADDIAQALFDNCFHITNGPDAPDVSWIEMDKELIAVFSNDINSSNNYNQTYHEKDLRAPTGTLDSEYVFEGYKIYQLAGPGNTIADIQANDPASTRLVQVVDIKNKVKKIYNWTSEKNPTNVSQNIWTPTEKVEGLDLGTRSTFDIKSDQFALGDNKSLINHKKYYYVVISYAYNNYAQFDPNTEIGQRKPYLEGRRNVQVYTVIPHPTVDRTLHANYGDGATVTRLDGKGSGINTNLDNKLEATNFLDMTDDMYDKILNNQFDGKITYKQGHAPINVKIYNPLDVKDGKFELIMEDTLVNTDTIVAKSTRWKLVNVDNPTVPIYSDYTIDQISEKLIADYGFSLAIGQPQDVATDPFNNKLNGAVGMKQTYTDNTKPGWFGGLNTWFGGSFFLNNAGQRDFDLDPSQSLTTTYPLFMPYELTDWLQIISPSYENASVSQAVQRIGNGAQPNRLDSLNNVDIILTPDKSKWSRCIVIESARTYYTATLGLTTEGTWGAGNVSDKNFDVRHVPSVGKDDTNGDGIPDPDGSGTKGLGWFPGYAVDVETGQRLDIFFGENSCYDGTIGHYADNNSKICRDMLWNPSSQVVLDSINGLNDQVFPLILGGQQYIYVTNIPYDECATLRARLDPEIAGSSVFKKKPVLERITWTCMPLLVNNQKLLPLNQGLIPNEMKIQLRVDNPYQVTHNSERTGLNAGYPKYQIDISGKAATEPTKNEVATILDNINVVPNPYYGYSQYEVSQFNNTVKITNLPNKCTVSIYTLDGKFIKEYKIDQGPTPSTIGNSGLLLNHPVPDIEWDMKNNKGIPVASGVYLINIDAGSLGSRTIKWFGVARENETNGL